MKFSITLVRDKDGVWIAEYPSIPGCVSQGATKHEAVRNIRDAIQQCLEVRAERGIPLCYDVRRYHSCRISESFQAELGYSFISHKLL